MSATNDQTLQAYEQNAQVYIDSVPGEISDHVREWIEYNLTKLTPGAAILEVGTASGKDADYIESRGFKVERTDAAESFVTLQQQQGHEARQLNVITDPIEYGYDMIFLDAVLLHLTKDELLQTVAKLYAALKENGRLVFSLKRGDGDETTDRKMNMQRFFQYWQPEEIEAVLFSVGFESVKDTIVADKRGSDKPEWLMLSAVKGNNV